MNISCISKNEVAYQMKSFKVETIIQQMSYIVIDKQYNNILFHQAILR